MRKVFLHIWGAALLAALPVTGSAAAEAPSIIRSECVSCHQLEGPAKADLTARQERKGPPLFYAGNKFRHEWLVAWLQNPTRIRPAGDVPASHTTPGANGDTVDSKSLSKHPAVDAAAAKTIADYLMSLTPKAPFLAKEDYTPGRVSPRMGTMDFVKFKGCGGCHRDTLKYGGLSGPELYTAWQRLQPAFIVSYIRNPADWDPRTLMPNKHLQTPAIHKLADYLRTIGEKPEKAK